jgi:hypothetical protein
MLQCKRCRVGLLYETLNVENEQHRENIINYGASHGVDKCKVVEWNEDDEEELAYLAAIPIDGEGH